MNGVMNPSVSAQCREIFD